MAEAADIERIKRGLALYNAGDFDGLRALLAPDVVLERDGGLPAVSGWEEVRAFMEPDAFEWQTLEPLEFETKGDRILVALHVRAKGASSGVELDTRGWHVWTMRAGRGVRMVATFDEGKARAAFELGHNDST